MLNQFYFLFEWYDLESELGCVVADFQRCVCCGASKLQNSSSDRLHTRRIVDIDGSCRRLLKSHTEQMCQVFSTLFL